ncbi:MAG: DUF4292 domain-containing protein [Tannerella sp.]|nr:DUF4292 domain-containing protein [Tannerella sp.]
MKNKPAATIICTCFTAALWLSGCRTHDVATVAPANNPATAENVFHALQTPPADYQTLSARLHIELTVGKEKTFSSRASLKILHDRKLQLSVQPLAGIEVMRIELSPDSIRILDRMNKRYLSATFEHVTESMHLPLNFHNMQALFTNRIFLPGETSLPDNAFRHFRHEQATQGFIFRTQDDTTGLNCRFTSRGDHLHATDITDNRHVLHLDYASFTPVEKWLFPMQVNAEWYDGDASKGSLSIRYANIDLDLPLDLRFDIPKNYEQVALSQILKLTGRI